MDEPRFRTAEERLWESVGVRPTERRIHLAHLDVTVRVQEVGDGPPIVFVHGASNGGASWANLVPLLGGFRCVLVDRPGCGLSEPLHGAAGNADIDAVKAVADVMIPDVLDALGLARAHVAATSYGGFFAFRAAAAHPERIDRVLEFSWPMGAPMAKVPWVMRLASVRGVGSLTARVPPTAATARLMLRQVGLRGALESGTFTPVMLDWFVSLLRDTPSLRNELRSTPHMIRPVRGLNAEMLLSADLLARVTMPVQFLWGEDDPNGGAAVARPFVEQFPDATLEVMAGAGHAPWIDDVDHAAAVTRRFFGR